MKFAELISPECESCAGESFGDECEICGPLSGCQCLGGLGVADWEILPANLTAGAYDFRYWLDNGDTGAGFSLSYRQALEAIAHNANLTYGLCNGVI